MGVCRGQLPCGFGDLGEELKFSSKCSGKPWMTFKQTPQLPHQFLLLHVILSSVECLAHVATMSVHEISE